MQALDPGHPKSCSFVVFQVSFQAGVCKKALKLISRHSGRYSLAQGQIDLIVLSSPPCPLIKELCHSMVNSTKLRRHLRNINSSKGEHGEEESA